MKNQKTVWITGASSGLGMHTAEAFAKSGWRVIAGARSFDAAKAETQVSGPGQCAGGSAEGNATGSTEGSIIRLPLDVTRADSCERFASEALRFSPRLDALVCGAAVLVLGSCERTSAEEFERVMQTNFLGTARMVSLALPMMRAGGGGKIILFSSINGLLGVPFQGAYTASKHALEGYAECLAMETREYGVRVCLVEPGDHRGGSERTRLHAEAENGSSPYHAAYARACAVIHRDESGGLFPEALGRKVVRNAERTRMRFRLRVAKPDQRLAVLLHAILPSRMNFGILRGYYLGGKKR